MRIFQTCFFIIEIIFWLALGTIIALYPKWFLGIKNHTKKERPKHMYLEKISDSKRFVIRKFNLWEVIWFVIVMGISVYFLKPYFRDIPQLITGKLNYVVGEVAETKHYSKDPIEYVYLSTGEEVKFFFSSDTSKHNYYKIGYLTFTRRVIYCEQIDISSSYKKVIGFPFKDILEYLAILCALIFLIFLSPYLKLKLFIPTNMVSIPTFIYFFIKYGTKNGVWFSVKNEGFLGLIFVLVSILITFLMYFIEKFRSDEFFMTYFFAQLFAICELGFFITLVFNLD